MSTTQEDTRRDRQERRPQSTESGRDGRATDRMKRVGYAVLGSALVARGLRRGSLRGAVTAALGGWLLSRALGGESRIERAISGGGAGDDREREGSDGSSGPTAVSRTVTVGRPADELYEVWRDPDRLSRIAGRFAEVTSSDEDRLHWTVHGPRGRDLSFETRIVEAEPGSLIRWETPSDAMLPNEGSVRFREAPGDRGTQVTLSVEFDPPGGELGTAALNRLDIVPETVVGEALGRFKRLAETGEITTLEDNPSARGKGDLL